MNTAYRVWDGEQMCYYGDEAYAFLLVNWVQLKEKFSDGLYG